MLGITPNYAATCFPRSPLEGAAAAAAAPPPGLKIPVAVGGENTYGTSLPMGPPPPQGARWGPFASAFLDPSAASTEASPLAAWPEGPKGPFWGAPMLPSGWLRLAGEINKTLKGALVRQEKDLEQNDPWGAFSVLSVTVRRPFTGPKVAALAYSFFPFLLFVLVALGAVASWAVLPLFALAMQLTTTLLSELVLKRLLKSPRPSPSLVSSPGMPSSHCLVAYVFLIWLLLESAVAGGPLPPRLLLGALAFLAFSPMPWARCYLQDHSELQCFVGCIGGALIGVFVFVLRRVAFPLAAPF